MSSERRRAARRTVQTAALVAAVLLVGCGKKGAPLPPLRWEAAPIGDLAARQQGSEVLLEGAYPTTTLSGLALGEVSGLFEGPLEVAKTDSVAEVSIVEPPPPVLPGGTVDAATVFLNQVIDHTLKAHFAPIAW